MGVSKRNMPAYSAGWYDQVDKNVYVSSVRAGTSLPIKIQVTD